MLLLAFELRVFRLDSQSFWSDEGASVVMASRSIPEILVNTAADIHPPLYYVLLHWWSLATGTSEFALRYFSLAFGVLAVAALPPLARRLAAFPVAIPALAVGAMAPFWVYYSQEARMYAPVLGLSALGAYCAIRLAQNHRPRYLWLGYVGFTLAALYTQYFAFTIFLFANVAFLIWNPSPLRRPSRWSRWALVQVIILAGYLPWLPTMLKQSSTWPAISDEIRPAEFVLDAIRVFSWGLAWDFTATARAIAFVALLLFASCYWVWRAMARDRGRLGRRRRYATLWLYLLTPLLVMLAMSLQRPAYNPKLLLVATPAFCVLLGAGITALGAGLAGFLIRFRVTKAVGARVAMPAMVMLLLGGTAYLDGRSLDAYYFIPKYARDDYRGLVRTIEQQARDGDAIVLTAPGQIEIFDYYYRGQLPRHPLPKQRPIDPRDTELRLQKLAGEHARFWMVRWAVEQADPQGLIEGWLAKNAFRTYERWFGNVQVILYQVAKFGATEATNPVKVTFGNKIDLLGYSVQQIEPGKAAFEPGEVIPLTLVWQGLQKMDERYTVFTHLVDRGEVHIWGQRDNEPAGGLKPTTIWAPGVTIVDNYGLQVLPGTPPGEYEIEVGLYRSESGERLPADTPTGPAGDRFVIGPILVQPAEDPAGQHADFTSPADFRFDGMHLVGFDFNRLGAPRDDRSLHVGQIAHLTLYWRADRTPSADYQMVVSVSGSPPLFDAGIAKIVRDPAFGALPTSAWRPGELIREQFKIPVQQSGTHRILIGVRNADQSASSATSSSSALSSTELLRFEVQP